MSTVIKPDKDFINDVLQSGGDSVKKCFQCANCTAVCELSTGEAPFPRKQMQLAGWGLKEKLAADPSIWYCHQCKDCSVHCPRNAKPADAISAIRLALIKHFSIPKFFGVIMSNPKYLPAVFLIPMAFIIFLKMLNGFVTGNYGYPGGEEVVYSGFLPHWILEFVYSGAFFLSIGAAALSGKRFWKGIDAANPGNPEKRTSLIPAIKATVLEFLFHKRFDKCGEDRNFKIYHLAIFVGFTGLLIVTAVVVVFAMAGLYPFDSLTHPLKILGNLAGLALIGGCLGAILNRLSARKTENAGSYQDWLFLLVLFGVAITGMLTQAFRLQIPSPALAYPTYFVHMIFVTILLVFMPYTKFAHFYYRFLALLHAKMTGRDIGLVCESIETAPATAPTNIETEEVKDEETKEEETAEIAQEPAS